jgi:hypothetical protein
MQNHPRAASSFSDGQWLCCSRFALISSMAPQNRSKSDPNYQEADRLIGTSVLSLVVDEDAAAAQERLHGITTASGIGRMRLLNEQRRVRWPKTAARSASNSGSRLTSLTPH